MACSQSNHIPGVPWIKSSTTAVDKQISEYELLANMTPSVCQQFYEFYGFAQSATSIHGICQPAVHDVLFIRESLNVSDYLLVIQMETTKITAGVESSPKHALCPPSWHARLQKMLMGRIYQKLLKQCAATLPPLMPPNRTQTIPQSKRVLHSPLATTAL